MATSTLTSKGQITIPLQVREALGVDAGDRIEFVEVAKGQFVMMAATRSLRELEGLIPRPAKPVSIHDMNVAIVRQASSQMTSPRKSISRKTRQ